MHIEEITDKTEALKVSDKPQQQQQQRQQQQPHQDDSDTEETSAAPIGPMPPLPPALAINRGKTVDEVAEELKKTPLFMTELDEESEEYQAIQALQYEGTPLENATDFKEQGNERFKQKNWGDARELYGKGVAVLAQEERRRRDGKPPREEDKDGDKPEEVARQRAVLEVLYVNRAACHLELRNYRSCWLDCAAALKLNPRNLKAWYRSAKALLAVGRIEEADEACARGLTINEKNAVLKGLAQDVVAKAKEAAEKARAEKERRDRDARRRALLAAALTARNIKLRSTSVRPETEDAKIELVPDPDDPKSTVNFPAVLLYPVDLQSDFIKAFNEKETLEQHFAYVFPLPWDREEQYTAAGVDCFVETTTGGLVKVGKKVQLIRALGADNVEVVDGIVRIYVVPRLKSDNWIKEYKTMKLKEKATARS